jgi:alcohol dehydrogenase class IV
MSSFTFQTAARIVCEDGAASRLVEHLVPLDVRRPLVVTDAGLVAAGLVAPVLQALRDGGVEPVVYQDVQADPPEAAVEAAVAFAREAGVDGVVGLGGGSAMDTAKLVALLVESGERVADLYGFQQTRGSRLPLALVPTTAGTGSEVTPIAVVTTPTDEKKGVVSALLYPDLALLDATLTLGLPPEVTAATGMDAMVHAIEAYTSRLKKNPISDAFAVSALRLLSANILRAVEDGGDLVARRAMLQGATAAGMAFAAAPVAAVHALAYPIGGRFHVPHGLSNALVLGPVLRFNIYAAEALYGELAEVVAHPEFPLAAQGPAARFVETMERLVEALPIPRRLSEIGVASADIPDMARDAMAVQRLLINNPRPVTYDDAVAIYRAAL